MRGGYFDDEPIGETVLLGGGAALQIAFVFDQTKIDVTDLHAFIVKMGAFL